MPSFPVSVAQNRESSPTRALYSASPTSSLTGRRSPIHDVQMDAIAEDCTEDSSTTPTATYPPTSMRSLSNPSSPRVSTSIRNKQIGGPNSPRQVTPKHSHGLEEPKQRRSGAISPVIQAQIEASISNEHSTMMLNGKRSPENGRTGHHHILPVSNGELPQTTNQGLIGMLQTPPMKTQNHFPLQFPPQTQFNQDYVYAQTLNDYNTHLAAVYHHTAMPHHHTNYAQTPVHSMLSHVSSVLNTCGIAYQHSNGAFHVDHQGVRLQILVGNFPHLAAQSAIQLQYVAGDTAHYQHLCSQLYTHLLSAAN